MKMRISCCAVLLLIGLGWGTAHAQVAYSVHTLEKGETLTILAKNYHTSVGDIMRLNGMNAQSQLHVGDQLKIPAGGTVVPEKKPAPVATAAPVTATAQTHVVAAGETLFHISQVYKIPVDRLKTLNNLPDGNLSVGQTLLVSEGTAPVQPAQTEPKPMAAAPAEQPVTKAAPAAAIPAPQPVPANTTVTATPAPQQQVTSAPAVTTPQNNTAATPQSSDADNAASAVYTPPVNAPAAGFFTPQYGKNVQGRKEQQKTGSSMTFKSASGWADKKYYILMNDAPTGSIVKIQNGSNELFAKVLWNLGEMKENNGLTFRISTATAAALGINDQKFNLNVTYYQ